VRRARSASARTAVAAAAIPLKRAAVEHGLPGQHHVWPAPGLPDLQAVLDLRKASEQCLRADAAQAVSVQSKDHTTSHTAGSRDPHTC